MSKAEVTTQRNWSSIYRGTQFEKPMVKAGEAIKEARLDWTVEQRPLLYTIEGQVEAKKVENPNFARYTHANVNSRTGGCVGVVGNKYQVIQNIDAFTFMDEVAGGAKLAYTGAGQFQGGRSVWIQARLPKDMVVGGKDRVEKKLTLITSHDGSSPVKMLFTPNRVACTNQLVHLKAAVTIHHFQNFRSKISDARRALGLALDFYSGFEKEAETIVKTKVNGSRLDGYFSRVLKIENGEASAQRLERRDILKGLFETGLGNQAEGVRGTLWAAYNAVTQFADHSQEAKSEGDPLAMVRSSWVGSAALLKSRAWEEALMEVAK